MTIRRNTLAATAVAAMLAASLSAPAAQAENGRIGSFIAGAVIGGALVNGINHAPPPRVQYYPQPVYPQNQYYYAPTTTVVRTIPSRCELSVDRGRGFERAYFRGCLEHAGFYSLPDRCDFTVYTERGPRTAIPERCMSRAGYRFDD